MAKNKKKTNNPFKMIGPWIGLTLFSIPSIIAIITFLGADLGAVKTLGLLFVPLFSAIGSVLQCKSVDTGLFFINECSGILSYTQYAIGFIIAGAFGFLLGYGTQLLIRKVKK